MPLVFPFAIPRDPSAHELCVPTWPRARQLLRGCCVQRGCWQGRCMPHPAPCASLGDPASGSLQRTWLGKRSGSQRAGATGQGAWDLCGQSHSLLQHQEWRCVAKDAVASGHRQQLRQLRIPEISLKPSGHTLSALAVPLVQEDAW